MAGETAENPTYLVQGLESQRRVLTLPLVADLLVCRRGPLCKEHVSQPRLWMMLRDDEECFRAARYVKDSRLMGSLTQRRIPARLSNILILDRF